MSAKQRLTVLSIILVMIMSLSGAVYAAVDQKAMELMNYYYDLILSGNYESARGIWDPSAVFRASRLGIEYDGIPLKVDCTSPIVNSIDRISLDRYPGLRGRSNLDNNIFRLKFGAMVDDREVEHIYYARQLGQDYWMFYPQDVYCKDWQEVDSKYFRFYINPHRIDFFSRPGADALDRFVEKVAEQINIPDDRLELLKQQKIDYYLCETEAELTKITDVEGSGYFNPASDAIFSINFPSFNLVAKQLINFRLQKLPLFAIPLMDEGFSIYLGGRWQRSPAVITDFGRYIINNDLTEIDSVLVTRNFDEATLADITYPVDACLVDYLIEKLGMDRFLELYKDLSGDALYRDTVSADYVKGVIAGVLDTDWAGVSSSFLAYLGNRPDRGGIIYPGQKINKDVLLVLDEMMLYGSKDWFQVKFFVPDSMANSFHYLFGKNEELDHKRSKLFDEQYKGKKQLDSYRYGLMVDKNEIGLYDYAANQLIGKYVYSFDPNPDYFNPEKKVITAYFSTDLFNGKIPDVEDGMVLK